MCRSRVGLSVPNFKKDMQEGVGNDQNALSLIGEYEAQKWSSDLQEKAVDWHGTETSSPRSLYCCLDSALGGETSVSHKSQWYPKTWNLEKKQLMALFIYLFILVWETVIEC